MTPAEKQEVVEKRFESLIACKPAFSEPENYAKIEKAYRFASHIHRAQFRQAHPYLPYMVHPIAVAKIVALEMGYGVTMVQAALLHDTVEDAIRVNGVPEITIDDITKEFGKKVSFLVETVTKITYKKDSVLTEQVETFKHLIIAMSKDRRVAYLKIADRLHNLRTMWGMKESSKMVKTAETLDLYAPLAHLLGLFEIKQEIEDWSFRYREPLEFERIETAALAHKNKHQKQQAEAFKQLSSILDRTTESYKIYSITKSLYKAWRIMLKENMSFDRIHNFRSIRIVLDESDKYTDSQLCFMLYGTLSDNFHIRPRSMKNWISDPKSNGFRAIVTDVFLNGEWTELQIMTSKMHEIALRGYADNYDNSHQENIQIWVKETKAELQNPDLSNTEIMELLRPQEREIKVFTPNGEIKRLPKGATVLDYAFHIHSDLGLKFKAAEVNGKLVPYNHVLRDSDTVYIVTDDNVKPPAIWLKTLVCPKNKNVFRRYLGKQKRLIIEKGAEIYNSIDNPKKDKYLNKILTNFKCKNKDKLFYKLGLGSVTKEEILKQLTWQNNLINRFDISIFTGNGNDAKEKTNNDNEVDIKFNYRGDFLISEVTDNMILADCCHPVRGDTAMVYKDGKQFQIHRRDCRKALELNRAHKKLTAVVKWSETNFGSFGAMIRFEGKDRKNLLQDVINLFSEQMDINLSKLQIEAKDNLFIGTIGFSVKNKTDLDNLLSKLRKIKDIKKVYRTS